jgi:hypothetical protein
MNKFLKDINSGEIRQRDKYQFELKSEFFPSEENKTNTFSQEFYIFIPNALQINPLNYSKKDFYQDLTNFIRYKTPVMSFQEILNPNNAESPLNRIANSSDLNIVSFELKLLANIVRSSVRDEVARLLKNSLSFSSLSKEIEEFRRRFIGLKIQTASKIPKEKIGTLFYYIDEFINDTIIYHLTSTLVHLKEKKVKPDSELVNLLIQEENHKEKELGLPIIPPDSEEQKEHVLYRTSLLRKYVLDALLLNTSKMRLQRRLQPFVGAISAGIAMLFFFVLFVWQGQVFVINSLPFIFITVFLYILKDQIKEGLRNISYEFFHKWFFDWKTEIRSPKGDLVLGEMTESFSLLKDKDLPHEINSIRNRDFHAVLEEIRRSESVICYKKKLKMYPKGVSHDLRRSELNTIFRFNIEKFLKRADDPKHPYICFDPKKQEIIRLDLPKVYHVNIIFKNTTNYNQQTEWKNFRLVIDKDGIKRIESL